MELVDTVCGSGRHWLITCGSGQDWSIACVGVDGNDS